jgi:excisionase family DNA binding protein
VKIEDNAVYTPSEVREILKISDSTFKRLVRDKKILTAKIGGQHRILGKEILRLLTPKTNKKASTR